MKTKTKKTSSVRRVYQQIKDKHPDCILLFLMFGCYESYFLDAELCSYVCDLPLEHRDRSGTVVPTVSIPSLEFNKHLRKMLSVGCRVTTCEQIGDRSVAITRNPRTVNA